MRECRPSLPNPGRARSVLRLEPLETRLLLSGAVERVSLAWDGAEGDAESFEPALSPDGSVAGFTSDATNLVPGDTNGLADVFVFERSSGTIECVSLAHDGGPADGLSFEPALSTDGQWVAFASQASDLVLSDTNGYGDVFLRDRDTGSLARLSTAHDVGETDGHSGRPAITPDGRYIVFDSSATNLVDGDTNGRRDVFVYDRQADALERVSLAHDGAQGDGHSVNAAISDDGRYVAFASDATNLVPGDTNGVRDVFVYDRQSDAIERVSIASDGAEGSEESDHPAISAGGRWVAFESRADNLVAADTNGALDVFVRDRQDAVTERVSITADGSEATGNSGRPDISGQGRYVAFESQAALVPDGGSAPSHAYVRDRTLGRTERVSAAYDGAPGDDASYTPALSADGSLVAFQSNASNLVPADGNGCRDVFVHDRSAAPLAWGLNGAGGIFVREAVGADDPDGVCWSRVPGKLAHLSVGEGAVWGVNEAGGIFLRDGVCSADRTGTGWSRVAGKLARLSVGAQGLTWGLNTAGGIFVRLGVTEAEPGGTGWGRVAGNLACVAVGDGTAWGLNDQGGIFMRQEVSPGTPAGTAWVRVHGQLAHIATGRAGLVWGVNANGGIFVRSGITAQQPAGTGWTRVTGKLSQVSCGFDDVWGLNASGGIFCRTGVDADVDPGGIAWDRCPGALAQVSVGLTGLRGQFDAVQTSACEAWPGWFTTADDRDADGDLVDAEETEGTWQRSA